MISSNSSNNGKWFNFFHFFFHCSYLMFDCLKFEVCVSVSNENCVRQFVIFCWMSWCKPTKPNQIKKSSHLIIRNLNNAIRSVDSDDLIVVSFIVCFYFLEEKIHLNMTAIGHKITIWNALWKCWTTNDRHEEKDKEERVRTTTTKKKKLYDENRRQRSKTKKTKKMESSQSKGNSFTRSYCMEQMGRSLIVISRINSTMIYVILFTNILSRRHMHLA